MSVKITTIKYPTVQIGDSSAGCGISVKHIYFIVDTIMKVRQSSCSISHMCEDNVSKLYTYLVTYEFVLTNKVENKLVMVGPYDKVVRALKQLIRIRYNKMDMVDKPEIIKKIPPKYLRILAEI